VNPNIPQNDIRSTQYVRNEIPDEIHPGRRVFEIRRDGIAKSSKDIDPE
jgi:hypothetical protein